MERKQKRNFLLKLAALLISALFLVIFFNPVVFAKYESIKGIELKGGTIVLGKILEWNDYVTIETKDGKISKYKDDDVVSFLKEGDERLSPGWNSVSNHLENLLQLDFRYSYFDYKEDVPPPFKSTEKGWIPGGAISWTRTKPDSAYVRAFLGFDAGDVKYDGTALPSGTPITDCDSYQFLFRAEANIGYTFAWGNFSVSPFTGYGYRYWRRGDSKVINSVMYVREDYDWMYIPVGLRVVAPVGEKLTLEPNFGARFMLNGRMKLRLTDFGYDNDPRVDLGNRIGYFIDIPIRYYLSRNWSLSLTPWYEYNSIGESNWEPAVMGGAIVGYISEPSSRTHQYGFNIGAGYSF